MHRDEVEWWLLGAGGRGEGELLFNGNIAAVEDGEKVGYKWW